ncbi:DUF802 domain-containing protein [Azoarcus sp. L1K30]|uniref:DUF802 domain-containing protein n=1 Tax=Azoarcus sp. L1K30 TaxID=2820277 RepID=UPI001B8466A2|nr:DUF802 domain-containing protein [Azoarcus sp. L1K30]MBR0566978.1 DUF802 domain-containing protein [Azoarcus sp. L1K30]
MNRIIYVAAFVVGMAVVCWVGAGYVGTSALALTVTALIGVVYAAGALELLRFDRATSALADALHTIPENLSHPGEWIAGLPPSLQNPVRLRIDGERVAMPGPAVTPYLVGLLVMLGMLGTFLGMVVTLNGAVIALESTTDLHTIRSALSAPVKGLGVAFGTSIAGVAASAMLGLMSALCRRARQHTTQVLEAKIATVLRGFSLTHQRQETFKAVQRQADVLPELVNTLQAMMAQMERQSSESNARLLAEQDRFHREARETYSALAASVDSSLKTSLTESARLAGDTIAPVVTATMSAIARETGALQAHLSDTVKVQLDGLSERFDTTVTKVADTWTTALAQHKDSNARMSAQLQDALAAWTGTFEQRSTALLDSVARAHAGLRADLAATTTAMTQEAGALNARLADAVEAQLDGVSARFATTANTVTEHWHAALSRHEEVSGRLNAQTEAALASLVDTFAERSAILLERLGEAAARLQTELAARDEARLAAQSQAMETMTATLQQAWQHAGAVTLTQQAQICEHLGDTARDISAEAKAQAKATIEEVSRLMNAAAEAPRIAADVIGELRQELSASMARDNALLAERSRIMETLGGLLDTINHASTEQRSAIDALVASSAAMLDGVGSRLTAHIEAESDRIGAAADQVTGGAIEVASLSEAFGVAVQLFSESNDKLMITLQRIEGALNKSVVRSDEQLAYYVAQAREIIDLSIMSQKQIVDDLQQLSGRQPALTDEA